MRLAKVRNRQGSGDWQPSDVVPTLLMPTSAASRRRLLVASGNRCLEAAPRYEDDALPHEEYRMTAITCAPVYRRRVNPWIPRSSPGRGATTQRLGDGMHYRMAFFRRIASVWSGRGLMAAQKPRWTVPPGTTVGMRIVRRPKPNRWHRLGFSAGPRRFASEVT